MDQNKLTTQKPELNTCCLVMYAKCNLTDQFLLLIQALAVVGTLKNFFFQFVNVICFLVISYRSEPLHYFHFRNFIL